MTHHEKPPMEVTEAAKPGELEMARAQGDAYTRALKHMMNEKAQGGEEKRAGDFIVAYAVEKAEGTYQLQDGELKWEEPQDENCHIEVSVRDAADHRFIPALVVHVRVTDSQGQEIGRHRQPLLWHPWLYHYGRNWHVPGDGRYTLEVSVKAPDFGRHDKENGRRYTDDVAVTFVDVQIKTGQKK